MAYLGSKFLGIVNSQPDMIPALIGGLMYMFVVAFIYSKMNVSSVREVAITGAWFGSTKLLFINTQLMALMTSAWGDLGYAVIDIAISAVMYATSGAAMGWALERFK